MDRVKEAIRKIPPKGSGEEPSTEKQHKYLRTFGFFDEATIQGLGKWQASYLIEEAIQIRDDERMDDEEPRQRSRGRAQKSKSSGCGCLLAIVAALLVGTVWVKSCGSDKPVPDSPPVAYAETTPKFPRVFKTPMTKPDPLPDVVAERVEVPAKSVTPPHPGLPSFEGTRLPSLIVVIEAFSLLDKTGKEMPIAPGTIIKVVSRTERGTLTMEINGAIFVGNEERLLHKVRFQ